MRKYLKTMVWGAGIVGVVLLLSGRFAETRRGVTGARGEAAVAGSAVDMDDSGAGCGQVAAGEAAGADRSVYVVVRLVQEMDRKTYSNKKVGAYLGEKFYTVKVDAETRAVIYLAGADVWV